MDAVVAKCVTTFGLNRINEGFEADCTLCIKKGSVELKIYCIVGNFRMVQIFALFVPLLISRK